MSKEIYNRPDEIKRISNAIADLTETSVPHASGTETVSTGGLAARYNDAILDLLDFDLKTSFQILMNNSQLKFKGIAKDFEKTDANASV